MAKSVTITISATDSFSSVFSAYQTAIRGASTDTDALNAKQGQSKSAVDSMVTSMQGAIAAYAGWKGINLVSDMVSLGQEANIAEGVFSSLVSTMGDYENVMVRLRTATGGIVSDMALQQGAGKFSSMGLAESPEELERLTELAIKLGSSMGMTPEKAFSDFALMLANNSIMRLDQFGLSSSAVRDRMAQLKQEMEGIDRSEAFKLAVLDIGADSLERLGSAASSASTPLNRFLTDIANKAQDFAQNVATGTNALIGIGELAYGQNPIQQAVARSATENAQTYLDTFKTALSGTDMAGYGAIVGDQGLQQALSSAFEKIALNPGASLAELFGNEQSQDTLTRAIVSTVTQAQTDAAAQLQQQASIDLISGAMRAGAPGAMIQNIAAEGFFPTQAFINAQQEIRNAHGTLAQFMGTYADLSSMPTLADFMRPEDADVITRMFENAQTDLEALQELHDQDLISDGQLQQAQAMTDSLGVMSEQAQAAANAFENLSLSQALGQGSGGMAGEITDMVERYLKDSGREGEIPAFLQSMGLASGRETTSSLALQNMIIPLLAGLSPDMAGTQAVNIQDFLQQAALQGMSQNRIAGLLPSMADKGFDYYNYDPLSSIGGKGKGGGMQDAESSTMNIAGNMAEAATEAEALTAAIESIPMTKEVVIKLTADDPNGLLALANGGSIGVQIRENGGTVPGTRGGAGTGGGGNGNAGSSGKHRPGAGR